MSLNKDDIKQLETHCRQIRSAIVKEKAKIHLFKNFPVGCCRDTSILTAKFLEENGYQNISYCSKDVDSTPSHAWLEYNNFIIDLTASQFPNTNFPEVLLLHTQDASTYHMPSRKELANLDILGFDLHYFLSDYELISASILKASK